MKTCITFLLLFLLCLPIPQAQAQDTATDEAGIEARVEAFTRRMKGRGGLYEELAGVERFPIAGDEDVKSGDLLIYGGDWAVIDRRLCSGLYGVSHETGEIWPIELTTPERHDTACETSHTSQVDALTLMRRYQWFSSLFIDWAHVLTVSPFVAGWKIGEDVDMAYQTEKSGLTADPHLAMYWLMHFGFTLDARYDEVKAIIGENGLALQLDAINDAIAFFDHTPPDHDIPISNSYTEKSEFDQIFLKRRTYLVYMAHSFRYAAGADGLEAWWYSISLYPELEQNMIRRMRWLGNNLEKYDQWQAFSALLAQEESPDTISLLSYVQALNPGESDAERQRQARRFLSELVEHEQLWKDHVERLFGRAMIWKLRERVGDNALLERATEIYFEGDSLSKEYQDIQTILTGEPEGENVVIVREKVTALRDLAKKYDRRRASASEAQAYASKTDAILAQAHAMSEDILFEVASNLDAKSAQERALRYLYLQDLDNKRDTFIRLFLRLEPNNRDIPRIFEGIFPNMFTGPEDPNIGLIQQIMLLPDAEFRNDTMARHGRGAATMFFLNSAHWPAVFEFLIKTFLEPGNNDLTSLKEEIVMNLFSREYATRINPTHEMSGAQLEEMLDAISEVLRSQGVRTHDVTEMLGAISRMDNPRAKAWMERHHNNRKWLRSFPDVEGSFDPLSEEMNDAIAISLEYIEERLSSGDAN